MKRLTKSDLIKFMDSYIKKHDLNLNVVNVVSCGMGVYSRQQFTPKTKVIVQDKEHDLIRFSIPCYYTLSELSDFIYNDKRELYLKFTTTFSLRNAEITIAP